MAQRLLLSHDHASVECGFSINKQMERANLCEETSVTPRNLYDHVKAVSGVMSVDCQSSCCYHVRHRVQTVISDNVLPNIISLLSSVSVLSILSGCSQARKTGSEKELVFICLIKDETLTYFTVVLLDIKMQLRAT